jgi:hypothetical protein
MSDFSFNPATRRYRDNRTGRFVSTEKVRQISQQTINARTQKTDKLTRDLLQKKITVSEWEEKMSFEIKNLTIQLYRVGKPDMSASDYGRIGQMLRTQYARLRKFCRDIILGTQSEAQIINRSKQYVAKSREAFEEGSRRGHALINKWEKRIITKKESCQECLFYESAGWQPIGTLPRPTERCTCRANCGCYFIFSNSRERPTQNMLSLNFGWTK